MPARKLFDQPVPLVNVVKVYEALCLSGVTMRRATIIENAAARLTNTN